MLIHYILIHVIAKIRQPFRESELGPEKSELGPCDKAQTFQDSAV